MEAIRVNLLSQITGYLSTLNRRQLTALVCEDCYERHDFMPETWPAFDFLRKEGICSFCFADRTVSSPYINHFLKQRCIPENQYEGCWEESKILIHNWLLPVGYLQQRREDLRLGECELWTWIQYGVTMRRAIRTTDLSNDDKAIFDAFFWRTYSAERYSLRSVHEVTDESDNPLPRRSPRPAQSDAKPKQTSFLFYKTMFMQLKNWKGGKGDETN